MQAGLYKPACIVVLSNQGICQALGVFGLRVRFLSAASGAGVSGAAGVAV